MKLQPTVGGSSLLGIIAGSALLLATGGCLSDGQAYRAEPSGRLRTAGVYVDDYDYFPGYEVYYSRNTHEYYYREGSTWISRPQPRGVTVEVLLAAPSVRMDFHDAPQAHHNTVVQTYPRNWKRPETNHDAKDERKDDRRADRKDDDRKDEDRKN
jgi:hypothetical protein